MLNSTFYLKAAGNTQRDKMTGTNPPCVICHVLNQFNYHVVFSSIQQTKDPMRCEGWNRDRTCGPRHVVFAQRSSSHICSLPKQRSITEYKSPVIILLQKMKNWKRIISFSQIKRLQRNKYYDGFKYFLKLLTTQNEGCPGNNGW